MKIEIDIPKGSHDLCIDDLRSAYTTHDPRHSFINNTLTRIESGRNLLPWMGGREDARYDVFFHSTRCPKPCVEMTRMFCHSLKLESQDGTGKVLFRFRFHIDKEHHKSKGVAAVLTSQEEELVARRWQASEIHALVVGTGFLAWTRPRFNYSIARASLLNLRAECARRKLVAEENARKFDAIDDFPPEFWTLLSENRSEISATFYKSVNC